MASGASFEEAAPGVRANPYERALLVRIYALGKFDKLSPLCSSYGAKARLQGVTAIARSGSVASEVP